MKRLQLTLFIADQKEAIEQIREKFNPEQYHLIPAHVTLCREDEIPELDIVRQNLKAINEKRPIQIRFGPVETFDNGKGLWLPAKADFEFNDLRRQVLNGNPLLFNKNSAHITLMHPRNSSCTAEIFEQVKALKLPDALRFHKVSLIEQRNGDPWVTLEEFQIWPG